MPGYTHSAYFLLLPVPRLTVMMPCLNEAKTLPVVLERIHAAVLGMADVEILVVDNGSTDASAQVATDAGARVVHEENPGYGNAIRLGLNEAKGEYILYADADASYDFGYIPAFLKRLEEGHDLVIGSRYHGRLDPRAMPWSHRYIGTPFLTALINVLYGASYWDCNCGMRALRRDAVAKLALRASGMEMASEMLIRARQLGLRIAQLPIDFSPDQRGGPSHLHTLRDGLRHMRLIISRRLFP